MILQRTSYLAFWNAWFSHILHVLSVWLHLKMQTPLRYKECAFKDTKVRDSLVRLWRTSEGKKRNFQATPGKEGYLDTDSISRLNFATVEQACLRWTLVKVKNRLKEMLRTEAKLNLSASTPLLWKGGAEPTSGTRKRKASIWLRVSSDLIVTRRGELTMHMKNVFFISAKQ